MVIPFLCQAALEGGALDLQAEGRWTSDGRNVILNTEREPRFCNPTTRHPRYGFSWVEARLAFESRLRRNRTSTFAFQLTGPSWRTQWNEDFCSGCLACLSR